VETVIDVSGIRLIMGDDPILKIESPYSDHETVTRLRAAAFLLEKKPEIDKISSQPQTE
jgi:hypothetical protein